MHHLPTMQGFQFLQYQLIHLLFPTSRILKIMLEGLFNPRAGILSLLNDINWSGFDFSHSLCNSCHRRRDWRCWAVPSWKCPKNQSWRRGCTSLACCFRQHSWSDTTSSRTDRTEPRAYECGYREHEDCQIQCRTCEEYGYHSIPREAEGGTLCLDWQA